MIWIGNVRARINIFDSMVQRIKKDGYDIGICGDLVLKGDNPVESIMLALDCADRIVIGLDTYHLFLAMHGNANSYTYLKGRGGESLFKSLKPFESLVQSLYTKTEIMYRCHVNRFVVTPSAIFKGFSIDKDSKFPITKLMNQNVNHTQCLKFMKHARIKQIISPSLSYPFKNNEKRIVNHDGICYLNHGYENLMGVADLSEETVDSQILTYHESV